MRKTTGRRDGRHTRRARGAAHAGGGTATKRRGGPRRSAGEKRWHAADLGREGGNAGRKGARVGKKSNWLWSNWLRSRRVKEGKKGQAAVKTPRDRSTSGLPAHVGTSDAGRDSRRKRESPRKSAHRTDVGTPDARRDFRCRKTQKPENLNILCNVGHKDDRHT